MSRIMLAEVKTLVNGLVISQGETHERFPESTDFLIVYDRESEPGSDTHDRFRLSITSPDLEGLAEFTGAALFLNDTMTGGIIATQPLLVGQSTPTERWVLIHRIPKDRSIILRLA